MRFNLLTRRIAVPALGLALAATVAACSSGSSTPSGSGSGSPASSSSAAGSGTPAAPASPSSAGTSSNAAAAAQIKKNWEKFFSSSTPAAQKAALLENGSKFAAAISAMAQLPLANGIGARVTKVVLISPTKATVTYGITSNGSTLLPGQTGTAVYQGGTWKVGDASLCALFKLVPGGTLPSACNGV